MKTATAKKQKQTTPADETTLQLTMTQFHRLQQVWYAFGELANMIDAPENDGGGLECLKIVNDQGLGRVIELQAQIDLRKKGGGA